MKSLCRAVPTALAFSMILLALGVPPPAMAQDKPANKSSQPTQKKDDLLTVEPAPKQGMADNSPQKASTQTAIEQPSGGQPQKPGTEVDEKQQLISNADLITLTVPVTDIYGRFVSGLGKNAFSIYDDKQQQEILFFSDDDSHVSVGVLFDVSGS